MNIEPKPDTVIRILMTYHRLDKDDGEFPPIRLDNYQTPSRRGFVVVEWGGILRGLDY